jgi:hypothetical protein
MADTDVGIENRKKKKYINSVNTRNLFWNCSCILSSFCPVEFNVNMKG